MEVNNIIWKDEFDVGVDYIDNAHRKLFATMRKMNEILATQSPEMARMTCIESIGFFKRYAMEHFAQEEAYQLEVGYRGYRMHKRLHDNLRDSILPAIERELIEEDFSKDSVEHFIGIFSGWLTGHIMIEDRAITGRIASKYKGTDNNMLIDELNNELVKFMDNLFSIKVEYLNRFYEGVYVSNCLYYEMNFNGYDVIIVSQKDVVVAETSMMLGKKIDTLDKAAMLSYVQLAQSIAKGALTILEPGGEYILSSHRVLDDEKLKERFDNAYPEFSLQWKTNLGYVALSIIKS